MFKKIITFIFVVFVSLSTATQVSGEICETNKINTALNYVNQDSLVFFNVTGTLYEPATTLADRRWREYFSERVKQNVSDPVASEGIINKVKNEIVSNIPKKLVDPIAPRIISDLQQKKIPVFGITRKKVSTPYAEDFGLITHQHLLSLGIDLEKTLAFLNVSGENNSSFSFAHGILFANKSPIDVALDGFLESNGFFPSQIIMVDDSRNSLEKIEQSLKNKNINFIGLRYSRADSHKTHFNPILGIIEFLAFVNEGKIISDEEASQIQASHPDVDYIQALDELIKNFATS